MAKKKIEDPEEGTTNTQKTKKEIRQERRQMNAVNAGREEMGGEKLYTKQEIRDVNKPFESKPSDVLTGTKQGTTYNDPNAPSKTTYEYQKTGLSSNLGNREVVEKTPITKEQFVALNADDPNTGSAIKKAMTEKIVADSKHTLQEKEQLLAATNLVEKEVNKTREDIDKQVKEEEKTQTTINTTDPNATTVVGGSGLNVAKITGAVDPNKEEWTSLVTKGEDYQAPSRDEIYEQARQAKVKAPQLAIEKLGLQDYYPEAGRNIAVGTFTGSRIGSQTIYSGAGGLLPLGLYDARKRAIATEIKKKEALVDQLKEMPDIAKQFKPYFAEKHMEFLSPWMDAFKDKPEELMRNTDFLKGLRQQQSIAENFLKVDANFKSLREKLVTDDGEPAAWANERMLKILNNFNAGMLPGEVEGYFDGTKNISDLEKNIREIPNAYNQADDIVKQLMGEGAVETAINMKTGKDFSPDDIKEINSLVQQLKSTSPDYETYAQLKRKFFDFSYEDIAKEWIEGNIPDLPKSERDAVIDSVSRYMFSQMPKDGIISTITNQANGYTERRGQDLSYKANQDRINAENWRFNKSREDHNSDTRAQIEAMEGGNLTETSLRVTDPKIAAGKTTNKEYKVWMMNPKGEWRQQFVAASEITRGNEAAAKNGRSMYTSNKNGSAFSVPNYGYFGVTENVIRKEGNNYIGNQYGVMFTPGELNPTTGVREYTPNNVEWRTGDDVLRTPNGYNASAVIGYNNAAGQDPKFGAKNLKAGGGKGSDGQSGSTYSSEPGN